ncbi:MAG: sigma-70 family RNA polymerase sigma factor [Myxococcota bacterium]
MAYEKLHMEGRWRRSKAGFDDVTALLTAWTTTMASTRIDLDSLPTVEVKALLNDGLNGDREAMRDIVLALTPVVQMRVVKALLRRSAQARGRGLRADVEDIVQDVFARLFRDGGKALRAWDPERGLTLPRFVSFLAAREVGMIMRRQRKNPWTEEPTVDRVLNRMCDDYDDHAKRVESRQMISMMADRLEERLSPQGLLYFQRLYLEGKAIKEVAEEFRTTPGALYTWRNRLMKLVREVEDELLSEGHGRG